MIIIICFPGAVSRVEFPEFRVIIDPGHGGRSLRPVSQHGDRYDSISGTYIDVYKEGAALYGSEEHAIMYAIARSAAALLKHCAPGGDFNAFHTILRRYTDADPKRVVIVSSLSRGDSRNDATIRARTDPNAEFRLFDYPDRSGAIRPGRASRINALRPHLVVSLHCATDGPSKYRGLNPVIVAPYSMLHQGLKYLQGSIRSPAFFYRSRYRDWFSESNHRPDIDWFLKDVSTYFTGFTTTLQGTINEKGFKGYRYNMITWPYRDRPGWELRAWHHPDRTPYAKSYHTLNASSPFWERERSEFERFRRDGGEEGFGGDNHYASVEIIRYVLYSLYLNSGRTHHPDQKPTRPYISIWSLPLHVNAINAFIELGYLRIPRHRYLLTSRQREIAEGIAVGIYSILAGLPLRAEAFPHLPKGKSIDFAKYTLSSSKSYFDCAANE